MRHSASRSFVAPLLACALLVAAAPLRAQDVPPTRPRRVAPAVESEKLKGEPVVRIGLATAARAVNVSTTGRLLSLTETGGEPAPLEVSSVRVEPRTYQPLPLNRNESAPATEEALRPTSRVGVVERGAAVYAAGAPKPLLDLRAPVVFSSDDAEAHPVRFNEKPYRGRLEVFANTKGTLTVVNVLGLEDYVRGVVPNELSPGRWPQLEALKAQAVAARTYAVGNLGRFGAEGFDLTPDTRSQVYGGRSTEHPLTDRAVEETRGLVATYEGRPINALYTSTCGGRTEHAELIFGGDPVPYLRARECSVEPARGPSASAVRSARPLPSIKMSEHAASPRDAALLAVHGFALPARLDDDWLEDFIPADDMRALLARVAALARQTPPTAGAEATRPAGFATVLLQALDGESRGAALLSPADVAYHLAFRDAADVPERHRADVAELLRAGHLGLFPDGTLRPRQAMTRARALHTIARALEARGHLRLQPASTRPADGGALVLTPADGKGQDQTLKAAPDVFLFRAFGEVLHQVSELTLVGGETVAFHLNPRGEIDYLEVRQAARGAASDRFSPVARWAVTLTPAQVLSRLGRAAVEVGTLLDLRVARRGESGRVLDLEVTGSEGTAHVRGGRVRTALGLREQLFVIDREFDEQGRVARFTFDGRGWGHGVGMCQTGAYGLALHGLTFDRILTTYYTGIQLSRLY